MLPPSYLCRWVDLIDGEDLGAVGRWDALHESGEHTTRTDLDVALRAAGCTLADDSFEAFDQAFQQVALEWLDAAALTRILRTDGPLAPEQFTAATVKVLEEQVWGQAFEAPLFCDQVQIVSQRIVGERHMKLSLRLDGILRDAIWFGRSEPVPLSGRMAYRINLNEYQGQQRVQMVVEAMLGNSPD